MMNKSKIDWCDFSWNPVTGCRQGCEYCYAKRQAQRFSGDIRVNKRSDQLQQVMHYRKNKDSEAYFTYSLQQPFKNEDGKNVPFPVGFEPTLHEYRLPMPAQKKKPANIFVCSMADLFGDWVPDEWIMRVFEACKAAPQHNYLFLTKNPARYCALANSGRLPDDKNFWYGSTVDRKHRPTFDGGIRWNTFISIEPLLESLDLGQYSFGCARWIIVGAETGNRREKIAPKREWIENIIETAGSTNARIFMKDSMELRAAWGDELMRQIPDELRHEEDMPIPHCKKCPDCISENDGKRGKRYYCQTEGAKRHIEGRYTRTSPPWCRKRGGKKQYE